MLVAFTIGFFTAFSICAWIAYAYYRRAKRRVSAIQQSIVDYQRATKTVSAACDRTFAKQ